MSGESAVGAASGGSSARERRFRWLVDSRLVTTALASVAVVVAAGLVQVSFGAYSMTLGQAWAAVFDPDVILNRQAWNAFLLGGELPEMSQESLIVWNIRLPRVVDRKSVV